MRTLTVRTLTPESYAPYGDVIMAAPHGEHGKPANMGTARRFNHVADLVNLRPGAGANVAVFRCEHRARWPMTIELLEKHSESTQAFIPMNARRYLVVVSLGDSRPDLDTLAVFVAAGNQGITYRPGVWHHPMIALDAPTDFACLVWEDGSERDCTVVDLTASERAAIEYPAG